ncbi:Bug family tripartite tricarboxylate transporter substrate binding protein [Bordetella genomosp. 13]|uniref:Bug family tripartite tricarboxylate transporter substrate binding protein n=1 Tax=Bordetella genomosp. 13 TaxID=463040 RepID=UPI0011A79ED9|nr:tripartite tricarboxylate transporter substrate binding protein [Bordetella genomosp. 13]
MKAFIACAALAALTAAAVAPAAHAAGYPERPVSVVVGFAPGGTNDILARLIAAKLQARLKQPFVVENRAGANSIIAADYVSRAAPDGYTIFVASSGALTINPAIYGKLGYDPTKDFKPVALLGSFPLVVVGNAAFKGDTLADLKTLARRNPDGALTHGVGSSTFQLAAEYYARQADTRLVQVSYRGTGPLVAALLGNEVDVGFVDVAGVIAQINAGKLKPLAVTTTQRSSVLPQVPTIAESGVPGYDVPVWTGLVVPRGTPDDVVAVLQSALKDILADPDTVARYRPLGMEVGDVDGAALGRRIADDIAKWTDVARTANIKVDQ